MSQAINNDTLYVHVGRPKNNNKFCECGVELTIENTRETKKGSGSLRSMCRDCERDKDRASHRKKHSQKKVSRGPLFAERSNRVGMAAQNYVVRKGKDRRIMVFENALCEECGGILRYDEHLEKVCSECGLVSEPITIFDAPNTEVAGRQLKDYEKSRYDLRIIVNRDGECDNRDSPVYENFRRKQLQLCGEEENSLLDFHERVLPLSHDLFHLRLGMSKSAEPF